MFKICCITINPGNCNLDCIINYKLNHTMEKLYRQITAKKHVSCRSVKVRVRTCWTFNKRDFLSSDIPTFLQVNYLQVAILVCLLAQTPADPCALSSLFSILNIFWLVHVDFNTWSNHRADMLNHPILHFLHKNSETQTGRILKCVFLFDNNIYTRWEL